MVVIYDMDQTHIYDNMDMAREEIINLYGSKVGMEAYSSLQTAPNGAAFRRYGGPLIKIVSVSEAEWINQKEIEIGMMVK